MVAIGQTIVRGFTLVMTIIALALIGNTIETAFAGNPSSINYAIFAAVFALVVLIYTFVAGFVEAIAMPIVMMAVDALAALFSVIAGIVLAAKLGVHSCGNKSYLVSNSLTNGAHNMSSRCHMLQAATFFFWMMFVGFVASSVMSVLGHKSGSMTGRSGMRKGGPSMSQV